MHLALWHKIINNCNPGTKPIRLPDGREARLVIVDDRPHQAIYPQGPENVKQWFTMALSPPVARKLMRRIMYEGYVLPNLMAIAATLLSEVYTTTSGTEERVRMKYRSSPIADFGICHGSARVTHEDRLMYYSMKNKTFTEGQDPDDHYWLYFTSMKGEEVYLDCCMFTFNLTCLIQTVGYPPPFREGIVTNVPCFWTEREIRKRCVSLYTERNRVSVLRNQKLHHAVRHCIDHVTDADLNVFYSLMETFSKKKMTEMENKLFKDWYRENCLNLGDVLDHRLWMNYPEHPLCGLELDPNESINGLQWGA